MVIRQPQKHSIWSKLSFQRAPRPPYNAVNYVHKKKTTRAAKKKTLHAARMATPPPTLCVLAPSSSSGSAPVRYVDFGHTTLKMHSTALRCGCCNFYMYTFC